MSRRAKVYSIAIVIALAFAAWGLVRTFSTPRATTTRVNAPAAPVETAHITATLYYASSDGRSLVAVRRDVPLAAGVLEQGRQILITQLQDAPQPYTSVIPKGTTLRAFYITDRGDAFVDLSKEVVTAHPGGSLTELLTVYSLVNAVTSNLPVVQRVQLLVDGKAVDTIAGHVDVRRPLEQDSSLVRGTRPEDPQLKTQDSKLKQ